MTLKKKILMGYGVLCALLSIVIAWSIMNIIYLGDATEAILSENYRSIHAAQNMIHALESQESDLIRLRLSKTAAAYSSDDESGNEKESDRDIIIRIQEADSQFIQWLSRAKDNITIQGEQDLVDAIEFDYSNYRSLLLSALSASSASSQKTSELTSDEELLSLSYAVREQCSNLYELNEATMYSARDQAGAIAVRAVWSTIIVAAAALILALVFSMILAEKLVKPLKQFIDASRVISAGDYRVQIPVQTKDELGLLAGEFNQMVSKLKRYHELNIEQIISEKNKVEAILTSIEDGMIVFEPSLRVTGINPAARSIFGLEFSDYSNLLCSDFISDQHVCEIIQKAVKTGKKPEIPDEERVFVIRKEDKVLHYLFSVTVTRGKDGDITGIVLLLRDVTYLKEVERTKSEFVMAASHELRTPLTSLGMSMDLLKRRIGSELEDREKELFDMAMEEIKRMKSLVFELLDLSRLEAGSIDLEFEWISVHALFTRVTEIFSGQLELKQVELSVEYPERDMQINADTNKITWVLSNLISNALRYVETGGNIILSSKRDNKHVFISVKDDGPGIPLEFQSKIFDKFVRVSKDSTSGSGLGLAICKEIVHAHGGSIWVDSVPGEGSTFTFIIPSFPAEKQAEKGQK